MSNVNNVTTGKPKIGGAIFRAPVGTTLPKDAKATLDPAFKGLGYVSDDGVTNSDAPDTDKVKAWGGDTVHVTNNGRDDTFKMTFIEALNVEVLKTVYGDKNVSGDLATGITVKANSDDPDPYTYVIDMILQNNTLKRTVIPNGTVTDIGDIKYTDGDLVGYETTISASPDDDGNTHYDYIIGTATAKGDAE